MRVLLVEDDRRQAELLASLLQKHGFRAEIAGTCEEGERLARSGVHEVIILDRLLPDGDGLRLCQELRRQGVQSPILMLTILIGLEERVTGLEAGADDYLPKPYAPEELVARVRALARRATRSLQEIEPICIADLEVDLSAHQVWRAGSLIPLTRTEFAVFTYLLRRAGRACTRDEIANHVWGLYAALSPNQVDVTIARLRKKIEADGGQRLLYTVRGVGYMVVKGS